MPRVPCRVTSVTFPVSFVFANTMPSFYVRVGVNAELHVIQAPGRLEHGRRVLVRTGRGVELADLVSPATAQRAVPSVEYLRSTTPEDELLLERLERYKREAVEECRVALAESGSKSVLLDVDQLFDGGSLILHFLGESDSIAQSVTEAIVNRYQSVVRSDEFAKLLSEGCGPGCGTAEGVGCGSNCSGCALAEHCVSS